MAVNPVLIIVGLTICFGGIYFRRLFSGIIGFMWGALFTVGLVLIIVGVRKFDLQDYIVPILMAGIILGFTSAVYYRICALINGFITGAFIAFIIAALANDFEATAGVIIIALIFGVISAVFSFKFYDYSFILITAFLGGLIASVGLYGLLSGSDLEEIAFALVMSSDGIAIILLVTLVLTAIGFIVQLKRLQTIGVNSSSYKYNGPSGAIKALHITGEWVSAFFQYVTLFLCKTKTELVEEKELLVAPAFTFFILPLLSSLLNTNYGSGWYSFVSWLSIISTSITLAVLVFFVLNRSKSFIYFVVAFYSVFSIVFNISSFSYLRHINGFWYVMLMILRYPVYVALLSLVAKLIKQKHLQPFILTCSAFLLNEFVYDWIMTGSIGVHITLYTAIRAVLLFACTYLLFKKRNSKNIFALSSPQSTQDTQKEQNTIDGSKLKSNSLFIILVSLSLIVVVSFVLAPSFRKRNSHRIESMDTAPAFPSSTDLLPSDYDYDLDIESMDIDQEQIIAEQSEESMLTPLKDGVYNVIFNKDDYLATEKGTYATVTVEEYVSFSNVVVESLKPGDTFRDEIIETINRYNTMVEINGIWGLVKDKGSSQWILYGPFGDAIMYSLDEPVPVCFPVGAQYYDERSGVIETGEDGERQLDRIEEYFDIVWWESSVIVTISVKEQLITEAHIYFKP